MADVRGLRRQGLPLPSDLAVQIANEAYEICEGQYQRLTIDGPLDEPAYLIELPTGQAMVLPPILQMATMADYDPIAAEIAELKRLQDELGRDDAAFSALPAEAKQHGGFDPYLSDPQVQRILRRRTMIMHRREKETVADVRAEAVLTEALNNAHPDWSAWREQVKGHPGADVGLYVKQEESLADRPIGDEVILREGRLLVTTETDRLPWPELQELSRFYSVKSSYEHLRDGGLWVPFKRPAKAIPTDKETSKTVFSDILAHLDHYQAIAIFTAVADLFPGTEPEQARAAMQMRILGVKLGLMRQSLIEARRAGALFEQSSSHVWAINLPLGQSPPHFRFAVGTREQRISLTVNTHGCLALSAWRVAPPPQLIHTVLDEFHRGRSQSRVWGRIDPVEDLGPE